MGPDLEMRVNVEGEDYLCRLCHIDDDLFRMEIYEINGQLLRVMPKRRHEVPVEILSIWDGENV